MKPIAATLSDDIHHAASARPIFRREAVGQHGHLLYSRERQVREDRLASPTVIAIQSVDLEPTLPPASAVGCKQVLVHEDVTLIDRWPIRGAQQWEKRNAAIRERCFFD